MRKIEIKFERAIRPPDRKWSGHKRVPLEDEAVPSFLMESAKGKFPKIEEELLSKHGIQIPDGWNVSDVLAVMALGCALLTDTDEIRFDPQKSNPEVSLVYDDFHDKRSMIAYHVNVNGVWYNGSLQTPDHPDENVLELGLVGMPRLVARDNKITYRTGIDFRGYGPSRAGEKLFGFVASQMKEL